MKWERTITVIGCHVGGEDNHVIVGGVLPPPGATMFDRKRYLETQADDLRRWLLLEPRGKPTLCVNLVTPPTRPDCDAGMIIMEATDYPPMSGSNTICTVTVLLETGMLPMREPVTRLTLDTPAGPVPVEARCRDGKVERVQFTNVPCFATDLDVPVAVEGLGRITPTAAPSSPSWTRPRSASPSSPSTRASWSVWAIASWPPSPARSRRAIRRTPTSRA